MMARTHVPIGITAALLLMPAHSIQEGIITVGAAALGSLIIDADHENSKSNAKILQVTGNAIKALLCAVVAYLAYRQGMTLKSSTSIYYGLSILLILSIPKRYIRFMTYGLLAFWIFHKAQTSSDYRWLIYVVPVAVMLAVSKHRSVTHSLIGAALMILAAYMVGVKIMHSTDFTLAFGAGYLMHMVADFFTDRGLPIIWPSEKRFSAPLTVTTNGFMENILGTAMGLACALLIYKQIIPFI